MIAKLRDNRWWIHGTIAGKFLRLPLGTANKQSADDYRSRVEQALREGRNSTEWPDLKKILPPRTFAALAEVGNYREPEAAPAVPTWSDLEAVFRTKMQQGVQLGKLAESTCSRYELASRWIHSCGEQRPTTSPNC